MNTIIDIIIKWIENFLFDRHHRVVVKGATSNLLDVTSGVPQGPALFLENINDICGNLSKSIIRFSTDDGLLYSPVSDSSDSLFFGVTCTCRGNGMSNEGWSLT